MQHGTRKMCNRDIIAEYCNDIRWIYATFSTIIEDTEIYKDD